MPRARPASKELTPLLLERMQRPQAEQLGQHIPRCGVSLGRDLRVLQRLVEVLGNEVLGVGFGEAVEVDEEVVPGLLLVVAVLEGFEGEERRAPREGCDDVGVGA